MPANNELMPVNDRTPAHITRAPIGRESFSTGGLTDPGAMSFEQLMQAAQAVADSGLWKEVNTPAKALSMMLLCQSEGLNPMQAMTRYHIAEGRRPSMKSETMQAEFQARGGIVKFLQWDDTCCRATFSHPSSPEPVEVEWTIERANRAGLTNRNPTWKSYPRNMLKARVISDGIGLVLPGARLGMYTPEEESDIAAEEREQRRATEGRERSEPSPAPPSPPSARPAPAGGNAGAAPKPNPALTKAHTAFAAQARHMKLDIDDPVTAKASPVKALSLARAIAAHLEWGPDAAATGLEGFSIDDWKSLTAAMADYRRTLTEQATGATEVEAATETAPATAATATSNEQPGLSSDDLGGDPFAEDDAPHQPSPMEKGI